MSESVKAKKKSPAAESTKTAEGKLQQAKSEAALPSLGILGMLRWAWTQLTSMRTALFLLLLLAVGAVPGSLFPQRPAGQHGQRLVRTDRYVGG